MFYDLPGVQIQAPIELESFKDFSSRRQSGRPALGLHCVDALPLANEPLFTAHHKEINIAVLKDGWQFFLPYAPSFAVQLSQDRKQIYAASMKEAWQQAAMLPLLRTAIECASAMEGTISLHSACVEMDHQAICFTAPSGTGKSTRAVQWVETLGAALISGDRPSLKLTSGGVLACGVPWDGKEKIYRNIRRPLRMICLIVRGERVSAVQLSRRHARQILMQQAFLPMWDTEAAASVMMQIRSLLDRVPVVQLQCGPDVASARQAYELIYHHPEEIGKEAEE